MEHLKIESLKPNEGKSLIIEVEKK